MSPLSFGKDTFNEMFLKAPSNLTLCNFSDGASTTSLGILLQWLNNSVTKKFFSMSNINLPAFILKLCSLKGKERRGNMAGLVDLSMAEGHV